MARASSPNAVDNEVLEEGDIFFFFRPTVNEDEPESLSDVQRFFIVLRSYRDRKLRLLVVGRKRLPDVKSHERVWGFVDTVASDPAEIKDELLGQAYETKTRGDRRRPVARPVGEGVYVITSSGGQLHLSYALGAPDRPAEAQRAFRIEPEASFVLSIKNPEAGAPPGAGLGEEDAAHYPERLQREFRGRRFEREDIRLLDYERAEFILVGAVRDPEAAYGREVGATLAANRDRADIRRDLKLDPSRFPLKPLFEGAWD